MIKQILIGVTILSFLVFAGYKAIVAFDIYQKDKEKIEFFKELEKQKQKMIEQEMIEKAFNTPLMDKLPKVLDGKG